MGYKIILVTGGTGGHIYPALSFAQAIKDRFNDAEILFVGNQDRMESTEIPKHGYAFFGLKTKSITGHAFHRALSYIRLMQTRTEVAHLLNTFKPDFVVGFGGYVCVPVILEATRKHIPSFIHEQNAIAGKANRFLARFVQGIAVSYPANLRQFPSHKSWLVGNPRTYSIQDLKKPFLLSDLGLNPSKKTVLFVMGSLGAESIHSIASIVLEKLHQNNIQAIYVTGQKHYDEFIEHNDERQGIRIVPYIDQIQAMHEVDLMITRGGATTAAEIMALGVASIIIPSPFVPNNHQFYNAQALLEHDACFIVEEKNLHADELYNLIEDLLSQPQKLHKLKENAKKLGHPHAAQDMLDHIVEIVG